MWLALLRFPIECDLQKVFLLNVILSLEEARAAVKHDDQALLRIFGWCNAKRVDENYFAPVLELALVLKRIFRPPV